MTRFYTDEEMQKIQNMDRNILKQNYNNLSESQKQDFGNTYRNTKKFGGFEGKELQGVEGYNENQVGIPGVNMIVKNNQNTVQTETPKIQGMDAVKFRDEPTGNLDLNYQNFQNIYRKQARGEKLGLAEQNFLTDLKLKSQFEGKSMQEIFGIETKQDKERKYQNLAMENRNIGAGDLRNTLASQGLNYDEIEKVIGYHQPYNDYLTTQRELKARSDEAFAKKRELLDRQLAETTHQIQENGKNRMNVLNSGLSFSGFGRSSYALERRDDIARSVNAEISIAQAKAQAELELYQAQLQGADAETLSALSSNLAEYTSALKNQQTENAKLAQSLNDEANVSLTQALDNMIALSGVKENDIDKELSKELGYLVNKKGEAVNVGEDGKPIYLLSGRKQNYEQEKDYRDFNYGVLKDDRDFGLKEAEFEHKASVDNAGLQIDWGKLGLEKEKFTHQKNQDALDYELKKAEQQGKVSENFIKGNQALFDDIRADTKNFSEINRQYKIMKNTWDAYITSDKSNKGTVEQKLVMVFNKMLDPGSVVREGEFARTAEGQAIITRLEEQVKRLNQGGAGISDKVLEDLVNGAELIFNSEKQTMMNKKENLKANAYHLGADPSFVDSYFNRELGIYGRVMNEEGDDTDDDVHTDKEWKKEVEEKTVYGPIQQPNYSASNKTKKDIKNNVAYSRRNFPKADQTALTKAIPRQAMNLAFSATRSKGQCGAFVNDYVQKLTGKRIMGDSYASKEKHINSDTPQLGGLAVWNPGGGIKEYGHTGIVVGVSGDYVVIRDANWKGDEKVMTRKVPIKTILASRGGGKGGFVNFS